MKYYSCQIPTGSGISAHHCLLITDSAFGARDVDHHLVCPIDLAGTFGSTLPTALTLIEPNNPPVPHPFQVVATLKKENEAFPHGPMFLFRIRFI